MKITFLGTGTSVGVPMIGCNCPVCRSADPRNRRRRAGLYVQSGPTHLVVDTPPDFREQVLEYGVPRLDAVFLTHSHADHVFGFDDVRRFNTMQQCVIPAYGSKATIRNMRRIFNYVHPDAHTPGMFRPRVTFRGIDKPLTVGSVQVTPLSVPHGDMEAYGYLFEAEGCSCAYIPDCEAVGEEVIRRTQGIDVMILDGLRHRPHPSHLTVADSVAILQRIGARRSFIVHMSHELDHAAASAEMPPGIDVSYDGLRLQWQAGEDPFSPAGGRPV